MQQQDVLKSAISDINTGALETGQPLSQRKIANRYGCGRTVAKRVLDDLLTAGYVEHCPGWSDGDYIVASASQDVLAQAVELRAVMETYAISKLSRIITKPMIRRLKEVNWEMLTTGMAGDYETSLEHSRQFHICIVEAVDVGPLAKPIDAIYRFEAFRNYGRKIGPEDVFKTACEHALMIDALEMGDHDRAVTISRYHILGDMEHMINQNTNMVA